MVSEAHRDAIWWPIALHSTMSRTMRPACTGHAAQQVALLASSTLACSLHAHARECDEWCGAQSTCVEAVGLHHIFWRGQRRPRGGRGCVGSQGCQLCHRLHLSLVSIRLIHSAYCPGEEPGTPSQLHRSPQAPPHRPHIRWPAASRAVRLPHTQG